MAESMALCAQGDAKGMLPVRDWRYKIEWAADVCVFTCPRAHHLYRYWRTTGKREEAHKEEAGGEKEVRKMSLTPGMQRAYVICKAVTAQIANCSCDCSGCVNAACDDVYACAFADCFAAVAACTQRVPSDSSRCTAPTQRNDVTL